MKSVGGNLVQGGIVSKKVTNIRNHIMEFTRRTWQEERLSYQNEGCKMVQSSNCRTQMMVYRFGSTISQEPIQRTGSIQKEGKRGGGLKEWRGRLGEERRSRKEVANSCIGMQERTKYRHDVCRIPGHVQSLGSKQLIMRVRSSHERKAGPWVSSVCSRSIGRVGRECKTGQIDLSNSQYLMGKAKC